MKNFSLLAALALAVMIGCTKSDPSTTTADSGTDATYVVTVEPGNAVPVGIARGTVENDQEMSLIGVIGGSSEPFVDGLAAFTIVDPGVEHCPPEEGCPMPWDYCCTQDQVKENIATVKVVDASGSPVGQDARQLLGVKELSTVVATGKVNVDDQGNMTMSATQIFIRPGT